MNIRAFAFVFLSAVWPATLLFSQTNLLSTSGNVGIGTLTPATALHVVGEIRADRTNNVALTSTSTLGVVIQQGNIGNDFVNGNNYLSIFAHDIQFNGTNWIRRNQYSNTWANVMNSQFFDVQFAAADGNGTANAIVTPTTYFRITPSGSVGIGTTNPGTNKLAVEGTIGARKVVVIQTNPFPDYVFDKNYPLSSLTSVEQYIKAHHHLPDIPSADSVARNGLDLGGNQAALLKKIEELTLYIIDQQQQIARLKERDKELEHLQAQIDELKVLLLKK